MNDFIGRFFRRDLDLQSKWWHRLFKVVFIVTIIVLVSFCALMFYSLEGSRATRQVILKTMKDYYSETKVSFEKQQFSDLPPGATVVSIPVFEGFVADENIGGSLGCVQSDGGVEWLSEYQAKNKINCTLSRTPQPPQGYVLDEPSSPCVVPKSVCDGDISRIVKYQTVEEYTLANYAKVGAETLLVTLLWSVVSLIIYYKGLIYIFYGTRRRAQ